MGGWFRGKMIKWEEMVRGKDVEMGVDGQWKDMEMGGDGQGEGCRNAKRQLR